MNKSVSSLVLAVALATASSLALAEGAAPTPPPAAGKPAPAPQGGQPGPGEPGMGPMGHKGGHGKHMGRRPQEKPESFTEESIRKMADGRVIKRSIEQRVGEGSFLRKEVITNPEGKSMTRTVTSTYDKDKKTWVRKMEGVDFDGSTWSRSKEGSMAPHEGEDDEAPQAKAAPERKAGKKSR